MRRLSELWFRLIESISIIILSCVFCLIAMVYLTHIDNEIERHLNHLSKITGNDGYSTISNILMFVTLAVDYILFVMPFAVIGIMIRGDKIGDKKRFILRFPLQVILFLLRAISRA